MRNRHVLDRYVLREWFKILVVTALGFPFVAITFELTDKLGKYLSQGITRKAIALGYFFSLPDKIFQVLPAAVLFATVFTISAMNRHSELTATKASGRSFNRVFIPIFIASVLTAAVGVVVGELTPPATTRELELLGEREIHSQSSRYNFVYRADQGWVYTIGSLTIREHTMRHVVMEREGTGPAYPTLAIQSPIARYNPQTARWMLMRGHFRMIAGPQQVITVGFDSMYTRNLVETPAALLAEPKAPEEMRYVELGHYINDIERSGGDARKLRVDRALKLAIPFTCIIIALFGAPLALTAPRGSGAAGVGLSLATTVVFLILIQLSRAIGGGGVLPPVLAAWIPNVIFGIAGLWMLRRAPT